MGEGGNTRGNVVKNEDDEGYSSMSWPSNPIRERFHFVNAHQPILAGEGFFNVVQLEVLAPDFGIPMKV